MPIKVTSIELITKENLKTIVQHYNLYKPCEFENIEFIEYKNKVNVVNEKISLNYGFRIPCSRPNFSYSNGTHKYMRWHIKTLSSIYNYPPFLPEEEVLLFRILRFVIGKEHVTYFRTYDQAIKNSPNFDISIFSKLLIKSPCRNISYDSVPTTKIEKKVLVDATELSISTNSGWKFPRVRI
jgi:hypothetical protein